MGDQRRSATYQDVIEAPAFNVAEIVDGELFLSPRPGAWSAFVKTRLGAMLGATLMLDRGIDDGWFILYEPELRAGANVLVPDVAGWRRTRMPYVGNEHEDDEGYDTIHDYPVVPDWICEVADPSTPIVDARKLLAYAAAGIEHLWLADPKQRTLETFRREGPHWRRCARYVGDALVREAPFEEVELELARVWVPR